MTIIEKANKWIADSGDDTEELQAAAEIMVGLMAEIEKCKQPAIKPEYREIERKAAEFFDWPTNNRDFVTSTSAILFAVSMIQAYCHSNPDVEEYCKGLELELEEWHKLKDPVSLHVSLLRGQPAQLSRETFLHLAGNHCPSSVLTERERWLMRQAWIAGFDSCEATSNLGMDSWLEDSAADAVTVEMVLAKDAPAPSYCHSDEAVEARCKELEKELERERTSTLGSFTYQQAKASGRREGMEEAARIAETQISKSNTIPHADATIIPVTMEWCTNVDIIPLLIRKAAQEVMA